MKNALVVLNYNNYQETLNFVENVCNYQNISEIIIVDNLSTNESFKKLKTIEGKRIHVISSGENKGYGSGNNFGIRYILKYLSVDNVIISNPDVLVTEKTIAQMTNFIDKHQHEHIGIVAPVMLSPGEEEIAKNTAWRLPTFLTDLQSLFYLTANKGRSSLSYPEPCGEKYQEVDVLPGSFFMIPLASITDVGLFSEATFLFCEERILSYKLLKAGYKNYLMLDSFYIHNHSTTIKSNVSKINTYKHLIDSKKVYLYKYLQISDWRKKVFSCLSKLSIFEKKIVYTILDIIRK